MGPVPPLFPKQPTDLPVCFVSGTTTPTTFYVTPLDPTTPLVLGHSWLTCYNPSIDWVMSCVSFPSENPDRIRLSEASVSTPVEATRQLQEHQSSLQPPSISSLSNSKSVTLPSEYADYADVFDKGKADRLPPHRSFDLKITLDGPQPPPSPRCRPTAPWCAACSTATAPSASAPRPRSTAGGSCSRRSTPWRTAWCRCRTIRRARRAPRRSDVTHLRAADALARCAQARRTIPAVRRGSRGASSDAREAFRGGPELALGVA